MPRALVAALVFHWSLAGANPGDPFESAAPGRGYAAPKFFMDMFSIVTESQLALDGNFDRGRCLSHVGTEETLID